MAYHIYSSKTHAEVRSQLPRQSLSSACTRSPGSKGGQRQTDLAYRGLQDAKGM